MDGMGPEELQKILTQARGGAGGSAGMAQAQGLQLIMDTIQRLEVALQQLHYNQAVIGQSTDLSRLVDNMVFGILVEKGILTEDELQERYEKDVVETHKKLVEDARKKLEETMQPPPEDQPEPEVQAETVPEPEPKEEPLIEVVQDIREAEKIASGPPVLASERMAAESGSNVVRFKDHEKKPESESKE
jgi:hypothetical protein